MNHPFITQIDHVGIYTEQPHSLFRFFTEALGLPVAFPFVTYPSYITGSVALGNCFLEITQLGSPPAPASPPFAARYHILGFLVQPDRLPHSLSELERRHVVHSGVMSFFAPDATDANPITMWDNVYLGGLLGSNVWQRLFFAMTRRSTAKPSTQRSALMQRLGVPLLLRAFRHGMPVLTAYYQNTDDHARAISRETLRACDGGELGVESVGQIAVNAPDVQEWAKLLGDPAVDKRFAWQLGEGPTLHLREDEKPGIASMTLQVTSLARARDRLVTMGVRVTEADDGMGFTVPQTRGLHMRLDQTLEP